MASHETLHQRPHPFTHRPHAHHILSTHDMMQVAHTTFHDDEICHETLLHLMKEAAHLDDVPPQPVSIQTLQALQLMLLLPRMLGLVSDLLDHSNASGPVIS